MHDDSFKPTDRSEEEPTPLRLGAEAWEAFQNNPTDDNYTRFYDLTSGLVYTICFRLLREDEEEARDAFQSVYLTLVEGVHSATTRIPKEEIETEIRRLARRHADTRRKRISRRGRREVSIEGIDVPESNCRSVREDLFHREVGELISAALDTFPETVRLAIVLHYYHGMTHQEIAEVLGVSRSKVTKIILTVLWYWIRQWISGSKAGSISRCCPYWS
jgi:RNA polymerase sigma factor (sigma-70 family)